jgi:hypothetical protein
VDLSQLPVDPEKLRLPHNSWIVDYNAEEHALNNFFKVVDDIRAGKAEGYKYPKHVLEAAWVNLETGEVTDKRLENEMQ